MSADDRPILLAIQHVPWEGPHRILDACGGLDVHTVKPLAGQALPDHDEVAGAVVMGGPMSVDEIDAHPELASEREWLAEARAPRRCRCSASASAPSSWRGRSGPR